MGKKQEKKGAPGWMATFADLMSLLLTFFVLLLSMSTLDATRFRKIAGSLKMAFGVQRKSIFDEPPKGSSPVQQEFRSGGSRNPMSIDSASANIVDQQLQAIKNKMKKQSLIAEKNRQKRLEQNLKKIFKKFEPEWKAGLIEIDKKDNDLILRVSEQAAFPANRTQLSTKFIPMLEKLADTLQGVEGEIVVAGHSDDKAVRSTKFKSNWEFSAARANTLTQALIHKGEVDSKRFTVQFHGPTKPLVRNNSDINRARNRRIELIIKH